MKLSIEQLKSRLEELSLANQSIIDAADHEGREITDDEQEAINSNAEEFDTVSTSLTVRARVQDQMDQMKGEGRKTSPQRPAAPANQRPAAGQGNKVYPSPKKVETNGGFESSGHFFQAVRNATLPDRAVDNRLRQDTTTTFGSESVGSEGGFLVPTDIRTDLIERLAGEDSLLPRCDQIKTNSNSVQIPMDENEPWDDTAGIYARWENEGGIKAESKIDLQQQNIRLNKLAAIVPVSDELLEDAPAIDGYIRRKAPEKINWKVSRAIIAGSGSGQPLGILSSPALITVPSGATPAGTIQSPSIFDMYARMYPAYRSNAVWLVNPELEASLLKMAFMLAPSATLPASPFPVYMPANGMSGSPYATLLGRPVIPTQAMNAAGSLGDIMFVDFRQYLTLVKTGAAGIKTDVSIHVYFVQDLTAFRFVLRIGGRPWPSRAINPRAGSYTQSPFITLQAR